MDGSRTPERMRPRWAVRPWPRAWWWHVWTPIWADGRGPYVSIGLWVLAVYRGY